MKTHFLILLLLCALLCGMLFSCRTPDADPWKQTDAAPDGTGTHTAEATVPTAPASPTTEDTAENLPDIPTKAPSDSATKIPQEASTTPPSAGETETVPSILDDRFWTENY